MIHKRDLLNLLNLEQETSRKLSDEVKRINEDLRQMNEMFIKYVKKLEQTINKKHQTFINAINSLADDDSIDGLSNQELLNKMIENINSPAFYTHTNSKGATYHLNVKSVSLRGGKEHPIYYFTKDFKPETATMLPSDCSVIENPRNGFLTIKKGVKIDVK